MTTKTREGRIQIVRLICLLAIILAGVLLVVAVTTPYRVVPILVAWFLSIVAVAGYEAIKTDSR